MPNSAPLWMTPIERQEYSRRDKVECARNKARVAAWLRGEPAEETMIETAVKAEEKTTGTGNQDSLLVEESGPTQASEMEEEYEIVEHDDLVEEGYVVV